MPLNRLVGQRETPSPVTIVVPLCRRPSPHAYMSLRGKIRLDTLERPGSEHGNHWGSPSVLRVYYHCKPRAYRPQGVSDIPEWSFTNVG